MRNLKLVSLFAGCGGTDLGFLGGFEYLGKIFKKHPVKLSYANDIDDGASDIFDRNFSVSINRGCIKDIAVDNIPDHDILTAGFPCQSYSIVAQNPVRLGIKDDNTGLLFEEVCRVLRVKQPKCFVCENVKGIVSANKGKAFPVIMKSLRDCGYHLTHMVLNAYHYGVPQKRERVFIVGFKEPEYLDLFCAPMPIEERRFLKEVLIPEKNISEKYFFSDKAVAGLKKANKAMNKGRVQNPQQPCNTVGAHLAKVSLNSTDPVLCIDQRYRRFTPREVARIQSFPDTFQLYGTDSKQYKALGNAIPPVLMWYVAQSIITALRKFNFLYEI